MKGGGKLGNYWREGANKRNSVSKGQSRELLDGRGNKKTSGSKGQSRGLVDGGGKQDWRVGIFGGGVQTRGYTEKKSRVAKHEAQFPPPLNCKFKTFVFLDMIGKYKIQFNYLGYDG